MSKYRLNLEEIELIEDWAMHVPVIKSLIETGLLVKFTESEWPQLGDEYCYIDPHGYVFYVKYENSQSDQWRKVIGNIFKTKAKAEHYKQDKLNGV